MNKNIEVSCLVCDWAGKKKEAKWHDMSDFADDSMCDNQKGSGMYECPECGEPCEVMDDPR